MTTAAPAGRRAAHRARTTEQIVAAALDAVAREGVSGLSMHGVARAVGLTPGALYRYFSSRDALVNEVLGIVLIDVRASLEAVQVLCPLARLVGFGGAWRAYAEAFPERFGLIAALLAAPQHVLSGPEAAQPTIAAAITTLTPLAAALHEAERAGLLAPGPVRERALAFFAAVHGAVSLRKQAAFAPDQIQLDAVLHELLGGLLRGWGAPPAALARALTTEAP